MKAKEKIRTKVSELPNYSNKYGQPRTQQELKDFFQKIDLVWGYKPWEKNI